MKAIKGIAFCLILLPLIISCSNDSGNNDSGNPTQEVMKLSQTIIYTPQMSNYTSKVVANYLDNQKVSETTYDGSNQITKKHEITYGPGISTSITYDSQNAFLCKEIYHYDSLNRISSIDFYENDPNELLYTRSYEYQGSDITVVNGANLIANYKTNSNNLLYYENFNSGALIRKLTYINDIPTQLDYNGEPLLTYDYYYTKPIRKSPVEINNYALINLNLSDMSESCQYYLKSVNQAPTISHFNYTTTLNSSFYPIFVKKVLNGTDYSEEYFYYE